jgi:Acetyltransferase (GNAT) domain
MSKILLHKNNQFILSIAKSIKEVEDMRDAWEMFQPPPVSAIDYFLAIIKFKNSVIRPHVILLKQRDKPTAMIVGRIENVDKGLRFKNKIFFKSRYRCLKIDIGCILGNISPSVCNLLISKLIESLKRKEADYVSFSEVNTDSYIYKIGNKLPGILCRDHFPSIQGHYRMTLPSSLEEYFKTKSRNKRSYYRRIIKRFETDFKGQIYVRRFQNQEEVETFCKDASKISRHTWQYKSDNGFLYSDSVLKSMMMIAKDGRFRSYILYKNKEPISFYYAFIHDHIWFYDCSGYNLEYSNYRIGTFLLLKIIEELCLDTYFDYMDFGWMDVNYKKDYCDLFWNEANFIIYQPSLRGVLLNAKSVFYHLSYQNWNWFINHFNGHENKA